MNLFYNRVFKVTKAPTSAKKYSVCDASFVIVLEQINERAHILISVLWEAKYLTNTIIVVEKT